MQNQTSTIDGQSLAEARRLLGECILFRSLDPKERQEIVAQARIRRYEAGETIFMMGSSGDSLMAILSGSVRISVRSAEGREAVLAILPSGEVLGEIALLDGKERTADAQALTTCNLAVLDRRDVMAFLDRHPNGWHGFVEVLCGRLRHTDQHIAEVAFLELPARLAKVLLRIAGNNGRISLSQRELGNMVVATRESVNKCLGDWQRQGIVKVEEAAIVVVKRDELGHLAEDL
ncbi:MAG: Crp/Fnr family transcriptional regulator [Pseudolabrys sp.]|nr:Crp/Fnr family transcriptional regulator [Pseudolabrys sp.]